MIVIPLTAALLWATIFFFTLYGTWLLKCYLTPKTLANPAYPPISILKPIKGQDADLDHNLESFFHIDYPEWEIVFCFESEYEPGYALVKKWQAKYPEVNSRILIERKLTGLNPKVALLKRAYKTAQYDWILISDSNIHIQPNFLTHLSQCTRKDVGVATGVVAGTLPKTIAATLEATVLNTFYARAMCVAHHVGQGYVVGKAMLFHKSVLDRAGGMDQLQSYAAEDYMAGFVTKQLGLKIALMPIPATQTLGHYTLQQYWQRHVRWGRLRKSQNPLAYAAEPLSYSLVSGWLLYFCTSTLFPHFTVPLVFLHFLCWFLCDAFSNYKLSGKLPFYFPLIWLIRESLALPHWIHAGIGNSILWRGQTFRILPGGLLQEKLYTG